jgi:hypothetical protein
MILAYPILGNITTYRIVMPAITILKNKTIQAGGSRGKLAAPTLQTTQTAATPLRANLDPQIS